MSLHQDRLNAEFKRVLSEAIRELKDPRLSQMCSITNVEITKDLKHAKVCVSVYDEEEKRAESIEVLQRAQGTLAKRVNQLLRIRRVPMMHFELDDSIEYSVHISKLINELNAQRAQTAEDEEPDEEQ
jgi:ribosome-binding factor A